MHHDGCPSKERGETSPQGGDGRVSTPGGWKPCGHKTPAPAEAGGRQDSPLPFRHCAVRLPASGADREPNAAAVSTAGGCARWQAPKTFLHPSTHSGTRTHTGTSCPASGCPHGTRPPVGAAAGAERASRSPLREQDPSPGQVLGGLLGISPPRLQASQMPSETGPSERHARSLSFPQPPGGRAHGGSPCAEVPAPPAQAREQRLCARRWERTSPGVLGAITQMLAPAGEVTGMR